MPWLASHLISFALIDFPTSKCRICKLTSFFAKLFTRTHMHTCTHACKIGRWPQNRVVTFFLVFGGCGAAPATFAFWVRRQSECHKSRPDAGPPPILPCSPLSRIQRLGWHPRKQQWNRQTGPGRRPGLMSKMRFRRQPEMSCEMRDAVAERNKSKAKRSRQSGAEQTEWAKNTRTVAKRSKRMR